MNRPGEVVPKKYTALHTKQEQYRLQERSSKSLLANVLDMEDDIRCETSSNGILPIKPEDNFHPLQGVRGELVSILKELRKITRRHRTKEDASNIRGDWKYAALVIDRLFLWICVTFTTVSTIAILFSAPHLSA